MRHVVLLSILLLASAAAFCQVSTTTDSVTQTAPAPQTNPNPDSRVTKDSPKQNTDSLIPKNDLAWQQNHVEMLYKHKAKSKWPSLIFGFLLVAGTGLWLLISTPLCRDQSYSPATNQLRPVKERPFSYSKSQLFWWTIIILSCFVAFYFYTGELAAFTPSMVLLLGGGLAVSGFGKIIDNAQIRQNNSEVPVRHQDLENSKGFFTDILSDDAGISIHRFQSVIFNLVFGIAFVSSFLSLISIGAFPFIDFDEWQLTMLGLSSAAYLGFKTNENNSATILQRKIEAAKVSQATPAPATAAFQNLQSNLAQQGQLNILAEQPVERDPRNF